MVKAVASLWSTDIAMACNRFFAWDSTGMALRRLDEVGGTIVVVVIVAAATVDGREEPSIPSESGLLAETKSSFNVMARNEVSPSG